MTQKQWCIRFVGLSVRRFVHDIKCDVIVAVAANQTFLRRRRKLFNVRMSITLTYIKKHKNANNTTVTTDNAR